MRNGAVYNDAFLICHEIYQAARELVNSRVPTTQLASPSKFLWRPDLRPRLVEYVADFARCGERALGAGRTGPGGDVTAARGSAWKSDRRAHFQPAEKCCHPESASSRESHGHQELSRVNKGGRGICFSAPFNEKADSSGPFIERRQQEFSPSGPRNDTLAYFSACSNRRRRIPRASRLILFRLYYLGGAEYEAARHVMGLSERTWSDWAEEVRARVGSELIRAGMYPPARYFREASARPAQAASTNGAPAAKMIPVPCEQNFD